MIDCKTAKQLKEAGFPQEDGNKSLLYWHKTEGKWEEWHVANPGKDDYRIPTLSELIEECGDSLEGLTKWWGGVKLKNWGAIYTRNMDSYQSIIEGKTPKEAMSYLYLKLNRKEEEKTNQDE